MATLTITGTATRIFFNGKGIEVTETYKTKEGKEATRKFTAWFTDDPQLSVGQSGTFSGLLTTKIDLWTNPDGSPKLDFSGKQGQSISVSINNATFTAGNAPKTSAAAIADSEMPF